jgi:hypothetical protein
MKTVGDGTIHKENMARSDWCFCTFTDGCFCTCQLGMPKVQGHVWWSEMLDMSFIMLHLLFDFTVACDSLAAASQAGGLHALLLADRRPSVALLVAAWAATATPQGIRIM